MIAEAKSFANRMLVYHFCYDFVASVYFNYLLSTLLVKLLYYTFDFLWDIAHGVSELVLHVIKPSKYASKSRSRSNVIQRS